MDESNSMNQLIIDDDGQPKGPSNFVIDEMMKNDPKQKRKELLITIRLKLFHYSLKQDDAEKMSESERIYYEKYEHYRKMQSLENKKFKKYKNEKPSKTLFFTVNQTIQDEYENEKENFFRNLNRKLSDDDGVKQSEPMAKACDKKYEPISNDDCSKNLLTKEENSESNSIQNSTNQEQPILNQSISNESEIYKLPDALQKQIDSISESDIDDYFRYYNGDDDSMENHGELESLLKYGPEGRVMRPYSDLNDWGQSSVIEIVDLENEEEEELQVSQTLFDAGDETENVVENAEEEVSESENIEQSEIGGDDVSNASTKDIMNEEKMDEEESGNESYESSDSEANENRIEEQLNDGFSEEKCQELLETGTVESLQQLSHILKHSNTSKQSWKKFYEIAVLFKLDKEYERVVSNIARLPEMSIKYHRRLQTIWDKSWENIELKAKKVSKLTSVQRFRMKNRHPYPDTITIGGRIKYGIPDKMKAILISYYDRVCKKPSQKDKENLAKRTNLTIKQVATFFKNRRNRQG